MKSTRNLIRASLIVAMGLILPVLFHMITANGPIFLPMHIPILIGAAFVSPWIALIAGALTPLLSSVTTGMPPLMPIAVLMSAELAAYGFTMSWLMIKRNMNIYAALVISMVVGRIALGISAIILTSFFAVKLNPVMYLKGAILSGVPGIVIQLLFVPIVIKALMRSLRQKRG